MPSELNRSGIVTQLPRVPTDERCGFYLLEKTLAYSGKKLFAGLKSSTQEQLQKACKYIKNRFRTELNTPKEHE